MSYRVAVVAEDPTNNGYIFRPLVEALLATCGKPQARVTVVTNPRTSGYEHAKILLRDELLDRYKYVDMILFLPDADGQDRSGDFDALEALASVRGANLICCAAQQEVETWLLAGHIEKLNAPWSIVRSDISVKENHFQPFIERHGDSRKPGSGREDLMKEAVSNLQGLISRCPELSQLRVRICASISEEDA